MTDYQCELVYRYPDNVRKMLTNSTMTISDFVMSCTNWQEDGNGDAYDFGLQIIPFTMKLHKMLNLTVQKSFVRIKI